MTYGRNDTEKSVYTYGEERIAEDDLQTDETAEYLYDGRGSVVQTTIYTEVELSITYDPFGEITGGVDENFVGYAYNGEESSEVTGLQYLRARYYDTELGSFLTIDSYLGSLDDVLSQNRYTYANNDPVNNIDPSGHYSVNVNGANQYYQSTGLNEIRDYMTASALWAGEVSAQNGYNNAVARANNTSFQNYASISGISQSTADSYINKGIAQAGQVSMNYGCSVPTVPNEAVAEFADNVNDARESANAKIESIKQNKKAQYDEYQEYLRWIKLQKEYLEWLNNSYFSDEEISSKYPFLIYSISFEHGDENSYGNLTKDDLLKMKSITKDDMNMTEEQHYNNMLALMKLFSKDDLEAVALDMADKFKADDSKPIDYSNETLTQAIKEHQNTIDYYEAVKEAVINILSENEGNIDSLYYDETVRDELSLIKAMRESDAKYLPSYGGGLSSETFSGLTICTHGWNSNEIYISSYETDGETFSGTLHFKFIDTFGLDEKDIEENKNIWGFINMSYGEIQGFRSWYILQHYDAYDKRYKPLNTVVEFDIEFFGKVK